jgi:hypothetical protein
MQTNGRRLDRLEAGRVDQDWLVALDWAASWIVAQIEAGARRDDTLFERMFDAMPDEHRRAAARHFGGDT